jgi:hypothetical protein
LSADPSLSVGVMNFSPAIVRILVLEPMTLLRRLASFMRELGPHAAVALFVPGGSVIAISLWAFQRPAASAHLSGSGVVCLAVIRTVLRAFIVFIPLMLASCASLGLYNMSDEWCARHADATAARCPENQDLARRTASRD